MTDEIELCIETANGNVIGPDHKYNPQLEYGEIIATCEVEEVEDTRIVAGQNGHEYIEYEESIGSHPEFQRLKEVSGVEGKPIFITADIWEDVENECIRQIDHR